jgi:hypothetical protein
MMWGGPHLASMGAKGAPDGIRAGQVVVLRVVAVRTEGE